MLTFLKLLQIDITNSTLLVQFFLGFKRRILGIDIFRVEFKGRLRSRGGGGGGLCKCGWCAIGG